jgi:DNA polymerase-3 subunit delta'
VNLLPWHQKTAGVLAKRVADDRLPHGLLLTAPEGWGLEILANWLALHLLGVQVERTAEDLAHPDLRWIKPEGAVIPIDVVRALVSFAVGTPQAAPCKVAVLVDADCLNRSAANALLKTLEEPPDGTFLLLTSCHPGRLLPTVRSRCQLVNLQPDAELARRWLQDTVATDDLEERMFEHGGAPLAVAEGIARGEVPLADVLAQALTSRQPQTLVQLLLEQQLVGVTGRWFRHVVALAAGATGDPVLAGLSPRGLSMFADELLWVRRQLVSSNSANERLMAERLLDSWRSLAGQARVTA